MIAPLWLVNKESQNLLINRQITPSRICKPYAFKMEINSRGDTGFGPPFWEKILNRQYGLL